MRYRLIFAFTALCLLVSCQSLALRERKLVSPDGSVVLEQVGKDSLDFQLFTNGHLVLGIPRVGLALSGVRDLELVKFVGAKRIDESYTMISGKKSLCENSANEYRYRFAGAEGVEMDLVLRLYNDGLAFKYEFRGLKDAVLEEELTQYYIEAGVNRWVTTFDKSYERFFDKVQTSLTPAQKHFTYTTLIEAGDDAWALVSEAGIGRGNSGSSLKNCPECEGLYSVFMDENELKFNGSWSSPWRLVIAGSLSEVVESTLVTDVSEPSVIGDTSWIKPGSVSWVYWANNHGSKDYKIVKEYVDMAYELGLPYVLIDCEWDIMGNGGTVDDIIAHADSLGVKTLLWYNSSTEWVSNGAGGPFYKLNKREDREAEYSMLEKRGIAGVKIDFFSGDTQATMDYCMDLVEDAARHHLYVNFHGATLPRGWQRTYPNLLSVEAVMGAEWYNNAPFLTKRAASHNAILPFTRNVVGSMDYTPCTFTDSQFPHITTHSHELALPVVFESGLTHWADRPSSYLSQSKEVKKFMKELPTAWDETKLLGGYPGESVIIARRYADRWYIAGLNGLDTAAVLELDYSRLGVLSTIGGCCSAAECNEAAGSTLVSDDSCNSVLSSQRRIVLFSDSCEDGAVISTLPSSIPCEARSGFVIVIE